MARALILTAVALLAGARSGHGQEADVEKWILPREDMAAAAPLEEGRFALGDLVFHRPEWIVRPGRDPLLAWIAFQPLEGDRILAASYRDGTLGEVALVTPAAGQLFDLTGIRNARGEPQLFWTRLEGLGAAILTSTLGEGRWSEPVALDLGSEKCFEPACARLADGTVWLAWRQYRFEPGWARGGYDVVAAPLDGARAGSPLLLSRDALSDWGPCLAATADGRLCAVWTRSSGREYEVVARWIDPAAHTAGGIVAVSRDGMADDFHPAAAAAPDGTVWVAWDRLVDPMRGHSFKNPRQIEVSVRLARIEGEAVTVPAFADAAEAARVPTARGLTTSGGRPRLLVDPQGRVHLVHRMLEQLADAFQFPLVGLTLRAAGFGAHQRIPASEGSAEAAAFALDETGGLLVAWHTRRGNGSPLPLPFPDAPADTAALREHGLFTNGCHPEGLGIARLPPAPAADGPAASVPAPPPADAPRTLPIGDVDQDPILRGDEHLRVRDGEREYRVYWGDLHRHSHYSYCSGGEEPEPAFWHEIGRDFFGYDFLALTDHSGPLSVFQWWETAKLADLHSVPSYCSLPGYEWSHPVQGHQNVILRGREDPFVSTALLDVRDHRALWDRLPAGRALTIPHHTAHLEMPYDWTVYDPDFLRLVEVYQASRGSYEFFGAFRAGRSATHLGGFVRDGLAAGRRFGIIASSDHGNGTSYAAVLAESLDREHLFEAMQARRTFGCTTKGMLVDLRVAGTLMGGEVEIAGLPEVRLRARGTQRLADVTVWRNGALLRAFGRGAPDPAATVELLLEVEPGPRFQPDADFVLSLRVAEGRFLRVGQLARGDSRVPGMRARSDQAVEWFVPGGFRAVLSPSSRRVRLVAPLGARLAVEAGATAAELSVRELRDGPLRIAAGRSSLTLFARGGEDVAVRPRQSSMDALTLEESFVDETAPSGDSWYYARVIQENREIAWSSPVFVRRP